MDFSALKTERLRELGRKRFAHPLSANYDHPETFGFETGGWISPYTRGASNVNADVMLVLQDWSSAERLRRLQPDVRIDIEQHGRYRKLRTNVRLESFLWEHLDMRLIDTYATNLFPFIKRKGSISATIPLRDLQQAARDFTLAEIEIVAPRCVIVFGRAASAALKSAQEELAAAQSVKIFSVVHPAARESLQLHGAAWQAVKEQIGEQQ